MNHLEAAAPTLSRAKARGRNLLYAALFLLPPLLPLSSQAVVLDWNNVSWTNGSFSQSFDIDPNHAGNDITVSLSLSSGSSYTNNPAINSTFTGGVSNTNKSLTLLPDFASQSSQIHVTITFLYANGVNNAKFSLFDIDTSTNHTWQDQVRDFSGTSSHNSALGATSVTGSADNTVTAGNSSVYNPFIATGTGNAPNSGAGSAAGNVTAQYGQSYVKSISFTYGSGTDALTNPSAQGIGLGNISFTPSAAPEINPAMGSILGCVAALALYVWRKRSQKGASQASACPVA